MIHLESLIAVITKNNSFYLLTVDFLGGKGPIIMHQKTLKVA